MARFRVDDGPERCGLVEDDAVVELSGTFDDWLTDPVPRAPEEDARRHRVGDVQLLPPIGRHAKIFCVGFNYATHGTELDREMPAQPTLFVRHPDSLVGHGSPVLRPAESVQLDWEGEVAIVVGRSARRVPASEAMAHVAGFTAFADNSVRDWQGHSTQATAGKNWASSGACGPWLRTPDAGPEGETFDGDAVALTVRLNGSVVQQDTTAHLAFSPADLIAYISTFTQLDPGDVIATGTPSGIGYRADPQRFLTSGDVLEVEVEGVGVLTNPVRDETSGRTTT